MKINDEKLIIPTVYTDYLNHWAIPPVTDGPKQIHNTCFSSLKHGDQLAIEC